MKKLALLLSLFVLAACGGGGSGDSKALDTNSSAPVTLSITKPAAKTLALTATNMRRILITNPVNPYLKGWSLTVPDYLDSAASPELSLFVANGYKIEVLDYDNATDPLAWNPTFYGTATFDVTVAGANVPVTLAAVTKPTASYPTTIDGSFIGDKTFDVSADFTGTTIYDTSAWSILGGYTAGSATKLLKSASGTTATITSPVPVSGGATATAYYLKTVFYIKSHLKKTGDYFNHYDASTAIPLTSESGTVVIPAN